MTDAPPPTPLPAKKKRRRKPRAGGQAPAQPGGPPRVDELAARAIDVIGAIDRLVVAIGKELGVPLDKEGELTIPIAVPLGASEPAKRVEALLAELRERVGAATASAHAFLSGQVYCFFTNSADSPYSHPPHRTDVFAGYAPTGKPEWIAFANLCLARKEPRVDRLYGEAPEILAFVQGPGELDDGLLPSFGRGSLVYKMLGQVVLGLVPEDLDPRSRAERVALSLQIVETSQPGLRHRLRLNIIGLPDEAIAIAAAEQQESSPAEAFRKVLRATRGRVDALGRRAAQAYRSGESFDLAPHVTGILTRLRGDVLRVLKSRDYRTRHAEERHQSGERPTALAIADALAAGDGRFFRDEHKDTIVVVGPRHRVHVFSLAGRHVTSLELQPAEIERRLDLKRWRFLERVGSELFKDALRRNLSPFSE